MIALTNDTFNSFISDNNVAVVDFWSTWCGPCKILGKKFDELSNTFSDKIAFAKCNVEDYDASMYNVQTVPTVILFKDGKEFSRVVGFNLNGINEMLSSV